MDEKTRTSITIDPVVLDKARVLADQDKRSLSSVIEILLERYIRESGDQLKQK